jgi:hypothetical protein
MFVPEPEASPDVNTEEAVLLADELSHEAHDSNEGALVEAVLSVDSEP